MSLEERKQKFMDKIAAHKAKHGKGKGHGIDPALIELAGLDLIENMEKPGADLPALVAEAKTHLKAMIGLLED